MLAIITSLRGGVVQDYDIVANEFELQPRYYVHFQTNTFEESMNTHISSSQLWLE